MPFRILLLLITAFASISSHSQFRYWIEDIERADSVLPDRTIKRMKGWFAKNLTIGVGLGPGLTTVPQVHGFTYVKAGGFSLAFNTYNGFNRPLYGGGFHYERLITTMYGRKAALFGTLGFEGIFSDQPYKDSCEDSDLYSIGARIKLHEKRVSVFGKLGVRRLYPYSCENRLIKPFVSAGVTIQPFRYNLTFYDKQYRHYLLKGYSKGKSRSFLHNWPNYFNAHGSIGVGTAHSLLVLPAVGVRVGAFHFDGTWFPLPYHVNVNLDLDLLSLKPEKQRWLIGGMAITDILPIDFFSFGGYVGIRDYQKRKSRSIKLGLYFDGYDQYFPYIDYSYHFYLFKFTDRLNQWRVLDRSNPFE